jgi:glycosyltransferase involved in cell wall biosynthesis
VKIALLTRALDYGGAERQLVTLAIGLHERGHHVVVTVFYAGGPLETELRDAGVPVYCLDKTGRWDMVSFMLRLVRFVNRETPDILHGYLAFPNILTVFLKLIFPGMRIVWGIRDSDMSADRYDWLEGNLYRIECLLSRFADLIITNSRAGLLHCIARGFPENRTIAIPNGIDVTRFSPNKNAGQELRLEWGVRDSQSLIGIVGRLDPMKDHPTFLKAAALLAEKRKDVRFICVGDGPDDYQRELCALGRQVGLGDKLIWTGGRDDMPALYNALDVVVSSSCYGEGFSNVIGEAMACGTSCVVTDVGDSAWIVGNTGEVVRPNSPEALVSGIEISLRKIRASDRHREGLRRVINDRFSVRELICKTESSLMHISRGSEATS